MNAAAHENGGESRHSVLLNEIAALKEQRNTLIQKLTACERETKRLRAEVQQLRGDS